MPAMPRARCNVCAMWILASRCKEKCLGMGPGYAFASPHDQVVLSALAAIVLSELVDKSTDEEFRNTIRRRDGKQLHLVMSDEFLEEGRSFEKGRDTLFEAVSKPDNTNDALQFYNSSTDYVTTSQGHLEITSRAVKTSWVEWDTYNLQPVKLTKNYTSAMVQSWDKFCFTGGVLEMSVQLPAAEGGLWPAAWMLGNLARATYLPSTMHVWPWSYNSCVPNIQHKQEISACNAAPGFGLLPHQGRGSPEIDLFELMPAHEEKRLGSLDSFLSSSLQVSPGVGDKALEKRWQEQWGQRGEAKIKMHRPMNGHELNSSYDWYRGLHTGNNSYLNSYFWGQEAGPQYDPSKDRIRKYFHDSVSVNTDITKPYDAFHAYRLEWQPGPGGYLYWYLDDQLLLGLDSASLEELTGAFVPTEPMYLILNTAFSSAWGFPKPCPASCTCCYDCADPACQCSLPQGLQNCSNLPATMRVDYIRLYQDPHDPQHSVGCSPLNFPTQDFIAAHRDRYADWQPMSDSAQRRYWAARSLVLLLIGLAWLALVLCGAWGLRHSYYGPSQRIKGGYRRIPDISVDEDVRLSGVKA
ncbi:beta-glucan synthesis-associated protein-domain-containing protein [Ochromonadaceae sp. CCMP2298]|nr:beta-glucan synthesis-associated protein-domain-containing protein [Ochromonadaceae sp. CCMP2298]